MNFSVIFAEIIKFSIEIINPRNKINPILHFPTKANNKNKTTPVIKSLLATDFTINFRSLAILIS